MTRDRQLTGAELALREVAKLKDLLRDVRAALWAEHLTGLPLLQSVRDDLIRRIDASGVEGRTK